MELRAVGGLPEIKASDDIGTMLADRDPPPEGAVVIVASTIVSKAEGRGRRLEAYEPGPRAERIAARLGERAGEPKDPRFAQAVLEESEELLIEDPFLLAVTRFGHVGVNAGIDRTNLPDGADVLLLPRDPSASAARIRGALPGSPPVIVADTSGRPFRIGQRGVAIGWAGMPATRDWRGRRDRRGRTLHVTVEAVVDELAGAANLLMGEADGGTPVVYVGDLDIEGIVGGDRLFRRDADDIVRAALRAWGGED
ncbi:MAG: coenzyme F420-0:L-glutamate ligase [Halobacteriales archaeon]